MKATESSGPVSPANNGMFVGRVRRRVNGSVERRGNLRNVTGQQRLHQTVLRIFPHHSMAIR